MGWGRVVNYKEYSAYYLKLQRIQHLIFVYSCNNHLKGLVEKQ